MRPPRDWALVTIAAAALAAAAPRPALAGPKIQSLDPERGIAGSNVLIKGTGFSEKPEENEVLVDGRQALVLSSTPEQIRFFIPTTPKPAVGSKLRIVVKVRGSDSEAATFTVAEEKDPELEKRRKDEQRRKLEGGPGFADPFKESDKVLRISRVEVIDTGPSPSCIVEGESSIPKGLFMTIVFGFYGNTEKPIETKKHVFSGDPGWKVVFGPYPGKVLLAGKYFVEVSFDMARQSPLDLKRAGWPDKLSESERGARERVQKRALADVGTAETVKRQDEEIQAHYVDLARRTTDLLDSLDRAYASAGRSYFRKPTGTAIDDDEWTKWLQGRDMGPYEPKKLRDDGRFIRGVHFNPEAWVKWLENEHLPALREAWKRHLAVKEKYVGARDENAQVQGDYLCSIVLKLTHRYTTEIYGKNKLDVPESLVSTRDFTGCTEAPQVARSWFEAQRKMLLGRLGLVGFDPSKKDPPKKDEKK